MAQVPHARLSELLDSPMAASFIRSVNVGQNESDTKEFTRISISLFHCFKDRYSSPTIRGRSTYCHARRNLGFTSKGDAPVPSYAQKMVASRKNLANAIQSYNDNDNHHEKMGNRPSALNGT